MELAKAGSIASIISSLIICLSFVAGIILYFSGFSDKDANLSTKIAVINTNISYMKDGIKELKKDVESLKSISKRVDKKIDTKKGEWAENMLKENIGYIPIYDFGTVKGYKLDYKSIINAVVKAAEKVRASKGTEVMLVCSGNIDGCKKAFPMPWGPNGNPNIPEKK